MTAEETEMPRSRSIAIQSERVRRRSPRALTSPASWIAPPNSSNFSVSVVLPASGCEMIAKVRRRAISSVGVVIAGFGCCGNARRHGQAPAAGYDREYDDGAPFLPTAGGRRAAWPSDTGG